MMFCSQRRSCAMLAAKKKLPAKAAAAGLQLVIQGAQRIGTLTAIMTPACQTATPPSRGPPEIDNGCTYRSRPNERTRCDCAGDATLAACSTPDEVSGAWLLLSEIASCDPAAPCWQFLQVCPRVPVRS